MIIWPEGADTDGRAVFRAEEPEDECQPEEIPAMLQTRLSFLFYPGQVIKFSGDKTLEQRFSAKGDRIRIKENMTKENNRLKSIRQVYNKVGFNWI